ncbi:MAG: hypothetical protein ACI8QZ_001928 [Chlamydiales bacterium]|jgi:hypothetical protein
MSNRLLAGYLPLVLLALPEASTAGPRVPQGDEPAPFTGDRDWEERGRTPDWGDNAPGRQVVDQKNTPIVEAPMVDLDALKNAVADTDLVIGLAANGVARAYPLKVLGGPQREIINDRLGEEPFAVNW